MQTVADGIADVFVAGRQIDGRGTLAEEKRLPIIVEVLEVHQDIQWALGAVWKTRGEEGAAQTFGSADRKSTALIEFGGCGIDGGCRVPEFAQKTDLAAVFPDVSSDEAAGPGDATHFGQRFGRIGDEIEAEAGDADVEAAIFQGQRDSVRDLIFDGVSGAMLPREIDLRSGAVEAQDTGRAEARRDGLAEDAGATAEVEPSRAGGSGEPVEELSSEKAAPARHPDFIG